MIHAHFICYQCDLEKLQLWILLIHKWMIDFDLPKYWLFQKEKKRTQSSPKTQLTQHKLFTQVLFTWWMCSRKTYSTTYHKKHMTLTCQYITLFSQERKKLERHYHNKILNTHNRFFLYPFSCNQYILKQIIALNFISMYGSDQLITTNPQLQKKKKEKKQKKQTNAMQYIITLVQPWFPWRKHLILASVCALTVVCKFLLIRHEFVLLSFERLPCWSPPLLPKTRSTGNLAPKYSC